MHKTAVNELGISGRVWYVDDGATLHTQGTRRDTASMSFTANSSPASRAAASRCSTVLVDPPMATSRATAFSNPCRLATEHLTGSAYNWSV